MITVERHGNGRLTKEVWEFWFYDRDMTLYLDSYRVFERLTKRHGYKCIFDYTRINQRNNTIKSITDVPWPDDVVKEAEWHLQLSLSVKKEFKR